MPAFKGAATGKNPFHLWPDACAVGIGAGLFQGPHESETGGGEINHYVTLGVSSWCTKYVIVKRYNEL